MPLRRRRVRALGRTFVVDRGVFDPHRHLSGVAYASVVGDLVAPGSRVLDLGTGTGILAAAADLAGAQVVATDIDPRAVACARTNLRGTGVDVRCGDLFAPVAGEVFDLVVTNPPYDIRPSRDHTLASPDFLVRFGAALAGHAPVAYLGFPADRADDLDILGVPVHLHRRIETAGHALGIFAIAP